MTKNCLTVPLGALLCCAIAFTGPPALADEHDGCTPEKLTPYWEEVGYGQHGDITGFMRLSHDARYLAFGSYANLFVPGVPGTSEGGTRQVYLLDRNTGEFELISIAAGDAKDDFSGNGISGWLLDMSPNGRYVAFTSVATNLTEHEVSGEFTQVYVRDRELDQTFLASISPKGEAGNDTSGFGTIGVSNNGRVAFSSMATNLVEHGGHAHQVFVHDLNTGETSIASLSSWGEAGEWGSSNATISADGSLVTFNSQAALVDGPYVHFHNVFARDLENGMTEVISVDDWGFDRHGVGTISDISDDGRYVAFIFDSGDPLDPMANPFLNVYVRDRLLGTTKSVSYPVDGPHFETPEFDMSISGDGKYVAFDSWSMMTEMEPNDQRQVYRVEVETLDVVMVSVDAHCQPIQEESDAIFPTMSGDGLNVTFTTVWDVLQDENVEHDWTHQIYLWTDPDGAEPIVGDLNGDGTVGVPDLLILLGSWGPCEDESCPADLNNDGVVGVPDLLILLSNWG